MSTCIVADKTVLAAQSTTPILAVVRERVGGFTKAKDSRGREVEGLWKRNARFYCQFSVPGIRSAAPSKCSCRRSTALTPNPAANSSPV